MRRFSGCSAPWAGKGGGKVGSQREARAFRFFLAASNSA